MVAVQHAGASNKEIKNSETVINMDSPVKAWDDVSISQDIEVGTMGGANSDTTRDDESAVRVPLCEGPKCDVESNADSDDELDEDAERGTPRENADQSEIDSCARSGVKAYIKGVVKLIGLLLLLFTFICTLDLLSSAFRLLGGKYTGSIFTQSEIMTNPVAGLMVGVLATVLVQSSSTSTSIVVTMVASGIIDVQTAIPIIMGANVGTSVTNTLVSLTQAAERDVFEKAFAGATVHDMFNWLTVLVLLPLEVTTGVLYKLTSLLVKSPALSSGEYKKQDLLKVITKPVTSLIIQLDKKVLKGIALGDEKYLGKSLIKRTSLCTSKSQVETNITSTILSMTENEVSTPDIGNNLATTTSSVSAELTTLNVTDDSTAIAECVNGKEIRSLFSILDLNDTTVGIILLVFSLVLLCVCLILIVKLLRSMMETKICGWIQKIVNADFPGVFRHLTGYVALLLGALMTVLVQSSSVFTSTLTPLVGVGLIEIERMYPLTLGSNIGTTMTSILAAMAASGGKLQVALQIALCHLFFNILGIMLFYPIPALRKLPIRAAKFLGKTTAKYRWFCVFYLITMFLLLPIVVFGISIAGKVTCICVLSFIAVLLISIVVLNVLQNKCSDKLPEKLRDWKFMPEPMRSLEPYDRIISSVITYMKQKFACCRRKEKIVGKKLSKPLLNRNSLDKTIIKTSPNKFSKSSLQFNFEKSPSSSPNSSNLSSVASSTISFSSDSSNTPIVKKSKLFRKSTKI